MKIKVFQDEDDATINKFIAVHVSTIISVSTAAHGHMNGGHFITILYIPK